MALNHYTPAASKEKLNLFSVNDDYTGEPVIVCKHDGAIELAQGISEDEATIRFWQRVADLLPSDKAEAMKDKLVLIKAINLLDRLKAKYFAEDGSKLTDRDWDECNELEDHFVRAE